MMALAAGLHAANIEGIDRIVEGVHAPAAPPRRAPPPSLGGCGAHAAAVISGR